mmetsp:Transcript_7521/g.11268  ORF Transcript_7521/g.11268 Transcript_7521/m.11268 type:complete len:403 (+) Transcript_7521:102-1310(+)
MGDEILTLVFGRSAVKCSEVLWEQRSFENDVELARLETEEEEDTITENDEKHREIMMKEHDPLWTANKGPRALVFDVREPPGEDWVVEEMKRWEDSTWRCGKNSKLTSSRKPTITPQSVPIPIWAGNEPVSGFQLHYDGMRGSGCLGMEWWESADDAIRKEIERCDRISAVLTIVDTQHGAFSGVATSFLTDLTDECRGAQRIVYCGLDDEEIIENNNQNQASRLTAASRSLAVRSLYELAHVFVPIDATKKSASIGAAIDLTTLPFRRKVIKLYDLTTRFAGRDLKRRFATLSTLSSLDILTPVFQPWRQATHRQTEDLFVHAPPGLGVPPISGAAIGSTFPTDLVANFLRPLAHRIDYSTNFEARRLIPKLVPASDELVEAHEDLIQILDNFLDEDRHNL